MQFSVGNPQGKVLSQPLVLAMNSVICMQVGVGLWYPHNIRGHALRLAGGDVNNLQLKSWVSKALIGQLTQIDSSLTSHQSIPYWLVHSVGLKQHAMLFQQLFVPLATARSVFFHIYIYYYSNDGKAGLNRMLPFNFEPKKKKEST